MDYSQYILAAVGLFAAGGGFYISRLINKTDQAETARITDMADQLESIPERITAHSEQLQKQFSDALSAQQMQFERFVERQNAQSERYAETTNSMRQSIDRLNFTLEHTSRDGETKISALTARIDTAMKEIDKLRQHYHDTIAPKLQTVELKLLNLENAQAAHEAGHR